MGTRSISAILVCAFGLSACGTSSSDDDQVLAIRQALPTKDAMQIVGPETQSSPQPAVTQATAAPQDAPYAKFYVFTRDVRDGVNAITASVLGTVWYIVHTRPTSVHDGEATWGPYTDALEPATYRFQVTRTAATEYSYLLQGRPKESSSEQDYKTILSGVGYSKDDPKHGDGNFMIDLETARTLDPVAHENDSGVISVVHDLPPTVTEEFAPLPRTIQVTLAPTNPPAHLEILSIAREDNTGSIVVDGQADIDESKKTALEDVTVASQWDAAGAGRSDVTLSGGDVPASVDPVTLVECWDTHFKQSYYKDSAGVSTAVGDISACAFADAAPLQP